MGLFFVVVGLVFTLVFLISNLIRTLRRQFTLRFIELLMVFFVVLMPLTGLLIDNLRNARFDLAEQLAVLGIVPLMIISVALAIVESIRPQGLRQSRGLMGFGSGVVVLLATLVYPIAGLLFEQSAVPLVRLPTPVNATPNFVDPCDFSTLGGRLSGEFLTIIASEVGISQAELLERFAQDGNLSAAQLVSDNGGNPDELVVALKQFVDNLLLSLIADGCIPAIARPLALAQIEPLIDDAVYANFDALIQGITQGIPGGNQQAAAPTSENTPNATQLQGTRVALITAIPTQDLRPTATATLTPTVTITPSPTMTRTPFPTLSPTPTRPRFVTATPTLTATLPNPCLATANFNVNVRDLPSLEDSQVVGNLPFQTVFTVFAPNDDQTWWLMQYEGISGWVSGEFISLTRPCYDLPPRQP